MPIVLRRTGHQSTTNVGTDGACRARSEPGTPARRLGVLRRALAAISLVAACALTSSAAVGQSQALLHGSSSSLTGWVTLNPTFSALSLAQNVKTGSLDWIVGGMHATASDTGGQSAYGWRHDHLLSPNWIRAVVANYGARPAYYEYAPIRFNSYVIGCRPVDWVPALEAGSLGNGAQFVDGVAVSGFDLEHFALSPLIAVAGSQGYTTQAPGFPGGVNSEDAARTMLRYLMAAHAGMLRNPDGSLTSYVVSDRAARYLMGNLVAALKLGSIATKDFKTIADYVYLRLLPNWMKLPSNDPNKGGELQVYNSVCWAIPSLYELAQLVPPGQYRQAVVAALEFQCFKLAYLQALVPGKACTVEKVSSWYNLTPAGITTQYYLGPWEVRSMLVAGEVLGVPACTAEGLAEAAKWKNDKEQKPWLVDPAGNYLF